RPKSAASTDQTFLWEKRAEANRPSPAAQNKIPPGPIAGKNGISMTLPTAAPARSQKYRVWTDLEYVANRFVNTRPARKNGRTRTIYIPKKYKNCVLKSTFSA